MRKKILSSILGLSMMLTMLPTTAFAAGSSSPVAKVPEKVVIDAEEGTALKTADYQSVSVGNITSNKSGGVTTYTIPLSGTVYYATEGVEDFTGGTEEFEHGHYLLLDLQRPEFITVTDGDYSDYWTTVEGSRNPDDAESVETGAMWKEGDYSQFVLYLEKYADLSKGFSITTADKESDATTKVVYKVDTSNLKLSTATKDFAVISEGRVNFDGEMVYASTLQTLTASGMSYTMNGGDSKYSIVLSGTSKWNGEDYEEEGHFIALDLKTPDELYGVDDVEVTATVGGEEVDYEGIDLDEEVNGLIIPLDGDDSMVVEDEKTGKKTITITFSWENDLCSDEDEMDSVTYIIDVTDVALETNAGLLHKVTVENGDDVTVAFYTKNEENKYIPVEDLNSVKAGTTLYFTVTPKTGVTLNGVKVGEDKLTLSDGYYSCTTADDNGGEDLVIVIDSHSNTHKVNLYPVSNGIVNVKSGSAVIVDGGTVGHNKDLTITIVADPGYELGSLKVNGEDKKDDVTPSSKAYTYTYTIEKVTEDTTIAVQMTEVRQKIAVTPVTGGSVSVKTSALLDEKVTATAQPGDGYELKSMTVSYTNEDGDTVFVAVTMNGNVGTFTMPAADVTITAEFKKASVVVEDAAKVEVDSEDETTATATVDSDTVKDALDEIVSNDKTQTEANITVPSKTDSENVETTKVELPKDLMTAINETVKSDENALTSVNVTIKTDVADVSINEGVLATVGKQDATLVVNKKDAETELKDKTDKDGNAIEPAKGTKSIEVKFVDNADKAIEVNADKDHAITLTLNFGITGLKAKGIELYYMASDGTVEKIDTYVEDVNGNVTFTVNHLTTFYLVEGEGDADTLTATWAKDPSGVYKYVVTVDGLTESADFGIQVTGMKDGKKNGGTTVYYTATSDAHGSKTFSFESEVEIVVFDGEATSLEMMDRLDSVTLVVGANNGGAQ